MSLANRIDQARQRSHQRDKYANAPDAWVGAVIDGANQILAPNGPAWVWVTLNKGGERGPFQQVINRSISPVWNLPVMLGVNKMGQPYIVDVAESQVDSFTSGSSGGSSNSFRTPQHSHEEGMGNYDLVNTKRLVEGKVWFRGTDGPYGVYINKFTYPDVNGNDVEWPGGVFDISSYITALAGQHQWVKVGIVRATNKPTALVSSPISVALPLLTSDLAAVSFKPNVPLSGVQITGGQSIQSEADFTDCSFIKYPSESQSLVSRTPTASDYVMTALDVLVGVTSTASARAITLPPVVSVVVGQVYTVKDESGGAATHNITVAGASGNIDGAGSKVISANYGVVRVYTDGTNWFTC